MKVYFRVDANATIGFGHAVRSLSLAKRLLVTKPFSEIVFLINNYKSLNEFVVREGYGVVTLPENIEEEQFLKSYFTGKERGVLIVDNLVNYKAEFIEQLTKHHNTALIHSYSEGRFFCNLAIYPAAHLPNEFVNDEKWKTSTAKLLHGFKYCLLNKDILSYSPKTSIKLPPKNVVFIAGGSDPTKSLLTIYRWVSKLNFPNANLQFLYGKGSNYSEQQLQQKNNSISFIPYNTTSIVNADMAVCAFGVTLYELVYLKIPTISYGHTQKHSEASERFAHWYGCTVNIGTISDLTERIFNNKLLEVMNNSEKLSVLHKRCRNLIDGKGVERIAEEIKAIIK